jgi:pyridoxine 5-phosphate synthase
MEVRMILLGVNIDHVATLRNARGTRYPSLAHAAGIAEQNGGDFITIHLREDRRHIVDSDVINLSSTVTTFINLEMACNEDVLDKALAAKPAKVTLVPERREEITTEGGLDVAGNLETVTRYTRNLQDAGITVSLFIEADNSMISAYVETGAREIEIHTGHYADASAEDQPAIIEKIADFTGKAVSSGLRVCAGHGLTYHNVQPLCKIEGIEELNIGHSIIGRALFTGLGPAVFEMKRLIREAESA